MSPLHYIIVIVLAARYVLLAWSRSQPHQLTGRASLQIVPASQRHQACFVCGELIRESLYLNLHIARAHIRRPAAGSDVSGLKSQMSTALGGLFDRAITNMLGGSKPKVPQNTKLKA